MPSLMPSAIVPVLHPCAVHATAISVLGSSASSAIRDADLAHVVLCCDPIAAYMLNTEGVVGKFRCS